MKALLASLAGLASIAGIRAAIKSYRARKSAGDIVADAVEAVIDELDPKK